ncbi:MAG: hypothetical protein RLN62_07175 [Rickettsiales bacterium]
MRIFGYRLKISSFLGFSGIILTFVLVSAITICYILFDNLKSREDNLNTRLLGNSLSLEYKLVRDFDYADNIINITGSRISQINNGNISKIYEILSNPVITSELSKNLFSWNLFDWISKDQLMRVSSTNGIYPSPHLITKRDFIKLGRKKPWVLFFETTAIGISSKRLVIPAGMAITDKNSNLLGYISVGFDIEKLRNNLLYSRTDHHVEFMLLDKNFKPILSSSHKSFSDENLTEHQKQLASVELDKMSHNQKIKKPIQIGPIVYSNLGEVEGYPFYIMSGFDNSYIKTYKFAYILPSVICILVITLIAMVAILFLNYRVNKFASGLTKYLKYSKEGSTKYKSTLKSFFLSEFIKCFAQIRSTISMLTVIKQRNSKLEKMRKSLKTSIATIYRLSHIVHNFDLSEKLEQTSTKVNINDVIKEILLYHKEFMLQNHISTSITVQTNIPKIYTLPDLLTFTFLAIISQILRAASYGSKINIQITAHKYADGSISTLLIHFKDNSLINITDEFPTKILNNDYILCDDGFLMMPIKLINKYLSAIGGSVKLHTKKFVGNNLTVEVPYNPKIKKPLIINKNNVVRISKG